MTRYMLDTNACIALIKDRPASMRARLVDLSPLEVGISSIVVAELWYGVAMSQRKKQNEAALKDFLDYVAVMDWPADAAQVYGRLRTALRRQGSPIGAMDLLIAAHAVYLEAILVTDNIREFSRVVGLKVENWVAGP